MLFHFREVESESENPTREYVTENELIPKVEDLFLLKTIVDNDATVWHFATHCNFGIDNTIGDVQVAVAIARYHLL